MIKLLRFLQPYRLFLLLIAVLAIAQVSANLYLPNLMSDIVNKGITAFNVNYIWQTGILMIMVTIAGTIAAVIGNFFASRVATGMSQKIRGEIFSRVQQFSLSEFNDLGTASLVTRTTNDTAQIQQVMVMMLNLLITAPITLIVGTVLALRQDLYLSQILLVIIPIIVGVIIIILIRAVPLFSSMQKRLDKLNLILDENLTGVRVIRAFNRIRYEEERFDKANRQVTDIAIRVNQLIAVMVPIMMFLINISSIAIIWFGGHRVAAGYLQIGAMFAFLQYFIQILFSLLMVALLFIIIPRGEASAKRINQILETHPGIKDPIKGESSADHSGTIEFKNVSFSHKNAEKPALSHLNFKILPGKITAIVGGTGSGKSTLVNLIPRFYDVTEGQILVDGLDVRRMSQKYLRDKISFVPQKAVLFSGTVSDNIRFGNQAATEDQIKKAAIVAQADEFISKMDGGYNSPIAQGGTNVSGGQMQRLSIARALVKKSEIYIFDDTFSALDFKTDAKLRAALKKELKNSTVIIVAQRVSTVIDADQIIVLHDGAVVGIGRHEQLMKTCKIYQEIVSSQLSSSEIKSFL
jgi:ATP-binding cassette subfamily B protein